MNVNPTAPVLTRDEIVIDTPLNVVWKTQTDIAAIRAWLNNLKRAAEQAEAG